MLVGNKCDMLTEKAVDTARGQALADEYGMKFFETSAKNNINVEDAFVSIARDIKKRLMDNPAAQKPAAGGATGVADLGAAAGKKEDGCCK